ncbi:hypothetical protein AMJ57_01055 [Parcubacteria bacterium SG8_24]|nr:MAG: hypothetical protein AMJ57_01055 [Parcubacteria bacterium SG8_24]
MENREIPAAEPEVRSPESGPEEMTSPETERPPSPQEPKAPEEPLQAAPPAPATPSLSPQAAPAAPAKDDYHVEIERLLEKKLWEVYLALPDSLRPRFKATGEQTAAQLRSMLDRSSIKPEKVDGLIRRWLKIIPRVCRFFLRQEAKIKTDEYMELYGKKTGQDEVVL